MKNKYFIEAQEELRKQYNIDVIDDVLLARKDKVTLYADHSKTDAIELKVISGNLETIGFDDQKSIHLSSIIDVFDFDNKYGKVTGKKDYFEETFRQIHDFSEPKDVSFPIISKQGRKWIRFNIHPLDKTPHISIFTIMDVTKLHTQEEETYAKTHIDPLTELFNKYTFDFHYGRVYLLPGFHVMFMDLDNLKEINDTYGHAIGNACLVAFAKLLKTHETEKNLFYRLGGDEFVGLLNGTTEEMTALAESIINQTREIQIPGYDIRLTASMGVMKAHQSEDLARKADDLMYQVKKAGKNNFLYKIEE
jgi:diguanylate cyclase